MEQGANRALKILIWPAMVLAAAGYGVNCLHHLPLVYLPLLAWLPYAVLVSAAALSWRFHSSRGLLTVALFTGLLAGVQYPPFSPQPSILPLSMGLVLPIALLVIACLKERGIATVAGLTRILVLLVAALATVHEAQYPNDAVVRLATSPERWLPWAAGVAFGIAFLGLLLRVYLLGSALDSAAVGVLMGGGLVLTAHSVPAAEVFVSAAGLLTLTALVQHSYGMAFLDELTGIPARRALKQELAGLSGRYTIAMVDIDHFKGFNDTYGHDVGDQCLRLVASRLSKVTGGGRAYRYGGEEFTVLFPSKAVKDAMDPLETLRQSIENNPMILRSPNRPKRKPKELPRGRQQVDKVTVTVSIGVAERSDRLPTSDDVIKAADQALYKAKKKGRNQVCR